MTNAPIQQRATTILPQMNAALLLSKLKRQGYTVRADGDALKVTGGPPLSPTLRTQIATQKPGLLMILSGTPPTEEWDEATAEKIVRRAIDVRDGRGYSDDPGYRQRQWDAGDRIDEAWLARDVAGLQAAVDEFLKLFPTSDKPANFLFTDEQGHDWYKVPGAIERDDFGDWPLA